MFSTVSQLISRHFKNLHLPNMLALEHARVDISAQRSARPRRSSLPCTLCLVQEQRAKSPGMFCAKSRDRGTSLKLAKPSLLRIQSVDDLKLTQETEMTLFNDERTQESPTSSCSFSFTLNYPEEDRTDFVDSSPMQIARSIDRSGDLLASHLFSKHLLSSPFKPSIDRSGNLRATSDS